MPLPGAMFSYHVDLWEHASKLFRLYHWQQAADIFEFLARDMTETRQRTKCLVNKALLEARLGDHKKAVLTVSEAVELGENWPITSYLAGLINCELSELEFAEAWFEACLEDLDGQDVDYSGEGLNFVLERKPVRHNLDAVREARMVEELGYNDAAPDNLCYLPAELLFEAPPRSNEPSPTIDQASDAEEKTHPSEAEAELVLPNSSDERPAVLSRVPSSAYSVASEPAQSTAPLIGDGLMESPKTISFEPSVPPSPAPITRKIPNHVSIKIDPTKALGSPALSSPGTPVAKELRSLERIRRRYAAIPNAGESPISPRPKIPYTWHGRQQMRYEPRDARGTSDSVRELARFVQDFAPEGGPHEVRRLKNSEMLEGSARDADEADGLDAEMRPLGITSSPAQEANLPVQQQRRRAETADADFNRPTLPRAGTAPARSGSLRKAIWPPKPAKETAARHKPSKIRWPFQDDKDDDDEAVAGSRSMLPPISAPVPAPSVGLKPTALDFIMGPDGKTVVIEKAPKTAPSRAWALERIGDARRSDKDPEVFEPGPPPAVPASRTEENASSPLLQSPLLQPTVYEPPAWRRRQQAAQAAQDRPTASRSTPRTGQPVRSSLVPAPLNIPSRPIQQPRPESEMDFTSPRPAPSPSPGDAPGLNISPPTPSSPTGAATPRRSGGRRSIPSIVSSVNMFEYLLDKMKKDRSP